ncbi:hypothetical protein C8J55DRAFT_566921 [Lentinula edodes]|uniref:Uncharacterized protein n=1 Tax=Lentinula lateritia TaxID=40482 RepID=A0A9W8ZQM9_9AGAR|nr:hypothetical protein C8J55DRAFT_566921 [Lentinula edodes]
MVRMTTGRKAPPLPRRKRVKHVESLKQNTENRRGPDELVKKSDPNQTPCSTPTAAVNTLRSSEVTKNTETNQSLPLPSTPAVNGIR